MYVYLSMYICIYMCLYIYMCICVRVCVCVCMCVCVLAIEKKCKLSDGLDVIVVLSCHTETRSDDTHHEGGIFVFLCVFPRVFLLI